MTTIPEIQTRLHELADALLLPMLFEMTDEDIGKQLRLLTVQLSRRPRVRQAPVVSRRMTPELRDKLREFALAHPEMTYQQIAELFGVQAGRVSEALAGKRK
jgi:hypothetical protein